MHFAVVDQITVADIPNKARVNALRLLQHVHPDNGFACFTWQELGVLFGVTEAVCRRHLGVLHQARLIHYSSNGDGQVYVTFKAWTPAGSAESQRESSNFSTENARPRAKNVEFFDDSRTPQVDSDQGTRVDARKTSNFSTENARGRAISDADLTRARALDLDLNTGRKVGRKDQPTYLPEGGAGETSPDQDEQARSVALLTDPDVGMWAQTARQLAARYPFEQILRHVMHWAYQFQQGDVSSPMVLEARLARSQGPPIGPGARASPLYRRHMPEVDGNGETEQDRINKYYPPEYRGVILGYSETLDDEEE